MGVPESGWYSICAPIVRLFAIEALRIAVMAVDVDVCGVCGIVWTKYTFRACIIADGWDDYACVSYLIKNSLEILVIREYDMIF